MPPTAAAPMTVALEEACISSSGVLATLDIATFDAIGGGATPLKAVADATRARLRKVRIYSALVHRTPTASHGEKVTRNLHDEERV